jgi:hypothetical protein
MSHGWKTDLSEPLFTYTSPEAQRATVYEFVSSIESYIYSEHQTKYVEDMKDCIFDPNVNSEMLTRAAIACFDYCISDEIRKYSGDLPAFTDSAAVYYRSDIYKQVFPRAVLQRLSQQLGYEPSVIVIGAPDHVTSYDVTLGRKGMLTPDFVFWVNEKSMPLEKPEPPCGVARQELYRSLLRCGVNPLPEAHGEATKKLRTNKSDQSETYYQKKYRRKSAIAFYATAEKLSSWEYRTAKHWGRLLDQRASEREAILFSSGTSANEAVIRSLASIASGPVYIHPYWYYENVPTANELFSQKTNDIREAQFLLLNLEPTNYFRLDNVSEDPILEVKKFVTQAWANPWQDKYLVIDATVNPLFLLEDYIGAKVPDNLKIVKTVSASKHQGGGRNYFFGVAFTPDEELTLQITQRKKEVGGALYESHRVHFPRPTASWLREKREKIVRLNFIAAHIPNNCNLWRVVPYSYHSFIYPPQCLLRAIVDMKHEAEDDELEERLKSINRHLYDIATLTVQLANSQDVEAGDSFGLPQTRISIQGGFNTLDGVTIRLKLPRICPGYTTKSNTIENVAQILLGKLDESLIFLGEA